VLQLAKIVSANKDSTTAEGAIHAVNSQTPVKILTQEIIPNLKAKEHGNHFIYDLGTMERCHQQLHTTHALNKSTHRSPREIV
jgi:hypothetical protein